MIQLNKVTKSFYHRPVFRDVSLSIDSGRLVALLGKNGAGKSTMLRIIAGLTSFDSGSIFIDNIALKSTNSDSRKDVLYIGHAPGLYPPLSAIENLNIAASYYGQSCSKDEIVTVLTKVGLTSQAKDTIRIYSQGMMQRLKLAMAILIPWKILLFDEPFTGLDEEGKLLTESLLSEWNNGQKSIVTVVHDHHWAKEHCDTIITLHNKGIGYSGNAMDISIEQLTNLLQRST